MCDRLAPASDAALSPVVRSAGWTSTSRRSTSCCVTRSATSCSREVAPVIDEHERERRFPIEIVQRIGALGWLGIPIPEDEGGAGLDTLAYAIAVEEIGRVWGSLGLIVAAHTSLGCGPLHLAGTPEQQARFLVPMARGEVIGGVRPDRAGRRQRLRWDADDGPPRGRPRRRDLGPRRRQALHHQRRPGGDVHRHRPDRDTRRRRRRDQRVHRPGRHARASASGASRRSSGCTRRRPASCCSTARGSRRPTCSGERGDGFRTFLRILDGGRISIGALAVGIAQAALDASIPYAQTREQFGRPIGSFQGVAFMIADMATEIEAARGLVWRAAWLKDQGRDFGLVAAQAKLFASEVSSRVTNDAIQIHGGYGYVTEYPVERYLRDAKLTEIGEGTSQVQRLVIARRILDLRVV